MLRSAWIGIKSGTCSAKLRPENGGRIQPAANQSVQLRLADQFTSEQICDISAGGTCVISAPANVLRPQWWGARMDGKSDDSGPWKAAIASCAQCTLELPANVVSRVTSTIDISGAGTRLTGQGANSIISGTGITIVRLSGPTTGGQVLENLQILDPVGSESTLGLLIDNGKGNANQVLVRNVTVRGKTKKGIAIKVSGSVNVHLDEVKEQWFATGLLAVPGGVSNTALRIDRSALIQNGPRGVDIESMGDVSCNGSDIEDNDGVGWYMGPPANTTTSTACHFEHNNDAQIEIAGAGTFLSVGNSIEGGTVKIGEHGQLTSVSEVLGSVSFINDSVVGLFSPGLVLIYPMLGPDAISGKGWTQTFGRAGMAQRGNPGTAYAWTGSSGYAFDKSVIAPGISSTGPPFRVAGCGTADPGSGASAGLLISNTTGTCTARIGLPSATHGWVCMATNQAHPGNSIVQTGGSVDSCTLTGTTDTGDKINLLAIAY